MDSAVYTRMADVEPRHWWFRVRRDIVLESMNKLIPQGSRILDMGCGTGFLTQGLGRFGRVLGCDSSTEALDFCRTHSDCDVLLTDEFFSRNDLHGSFDVICLFDVIEHIDDDRALLKNLVPYLKPNGRFVLTVPAFNIFWGHHDVVSQHKRRYHAAAVHDVLGDIGFAPIKNTYFNLLLSPLVFFSRLLERFTRKMPADGDLELPPRWINDLLLRVFSIETRLIKWFSLPFGVSYLGIYERPKR